MPQNENEPVSRAGALKHFAAAALAAGVGVAATAADAADNKKQYKYQDKPKGAAKCSNCTLFKPPHGCLVVNGKISPNGWCTAYAKKA
ncbi:MAG: hypothetical protein NVSMB5_19120 [Candidatus Velthaea sp.]